ncbi:aminotransferase class I/II-fold pyridoxal phosphate-dependent enzyme [Bradyrhizobium yuanmingense]|uniref:aminotransferase class I/II-fold pyridoxal phosphate-dependent enzyme n=1 Tax=Bradyrhizobium yuanmingense TaxID=108015 RepID=UPI0023BA2D5E|nr:aminotransferase class I/II-fold pyridoxal phosphate-dependent enzyme [Bradyrhizobium yuanmingense]MDF0498945.1 aminotransferase class I/II-fold pyridoxal phosphate-dependent enzyme [Bradyrhizobium yuanmingense]
MSIIDRQRLTRSSSGMLAALEIASAITLGSFGSTSGPSFPNVIVLKSLGKIYGTCGLRMGYAASANAQTMNEIKAALPAWNVNTFAEFFLKKLLTWRTRRRRVG